MAYVSVLSSGQLFLFLSNTVPIPMYPFFAFQQDIGAAISYLQVPGTEVSDRCIRGVRFDKSKKVKDFQSLATVGW